MKKRIFRILSVILIVCLMVIPVNAASDEETTNGFTYTPILTNGVLMRKLFPFMPHAILGLVSFFITTSCLIGWNTRFSRGMTFL